jgi:hypothetical protein
MEDYPCSHRHLFYRRAVVLPAVGLFHELRRSGCLCFPAADGSSHGYGRSVIPGAARISFGIVFYALRDIFFSKPRGWTTIWQVLIFVGILSPFSAVPGSIEGVVYSILPLWFHIMSLPELFIQSFLLAFLTDYWVNHAEKKWLTVSFGIVFAIVTLLASLGILSALGFLPAPA